MVDIQSKTEFSSLDGVLDINHVTDVTTIAYESTASGEVSCVILEFVHNLSRRENLSWIRMTRSARQDARRSGKEDAGHSVLLEGCLFGSKGEHTERGLVGT